VTAPSPYPGSMTAATATTPAKLAALCDALRAEIVPGATGEPIVRLTLVIDDPAPRLRTWPLDALRSMETLAWDEAARLGIAEWVYVKHRPLSAVRNARRPHRSSR